LGKTTCQAQGRRRASLHSTRPTINSEKNAGFPPPTAAGGGARDVNGQDKPKVRYNGDAP